MKTIVVDVVQGLKFKVGEVTDGIVDKEERIEFAQHAHHTGDASVTAAVAINKQVISIANKVTGFKEDDKGVVPTTIAILSQGWDGTGPGPGTVLPECSLSLHSNSGPSKAALQVGDQKATLGTHRLDLTCGIAEHGRETSLGEWTDAPFDPSQFKLSDGGTWTVKAGQPTAGNVQDFSYCIVGHTMTLSVNLNATVVIPPPADQFNQNGRDLLVPIPAPFVAVREQWAVGRAADAGKRGFCTITSLPDQPVLVIRNGDYSRWAATDDKLKTHVRFTITFEVKERRA